MSLIALVLYGAINVVMVISHLFSKERVFEFPFWAGALALGWFFPMAIGGYVNVDSYPGNAFANGMFFASLCTIALWVGFAKGFKRVADKPSWLDVKFDPDKLINVCIFLTVGGLFFYWKLQNLPEEMLQQTQWSGATVKYLFLASVFQFGFIGLWLIYLYQRKWLAPKLLIFLIPGLLLLLKAAVLGGRRAEMMNCVSFLFVSLWFVRRVAPPLWLIAVGVGLGLMVINSISTYRGIMSNEEMSFKERLAAASKADYTSESKNLMKESGFDFNNYIYLRQVTAEDFVVDFGVEHWNGFIFNYVPAQIVGRATKKALTIPFRYSATAVASKRYDHFYGPGTVRTGYYDSFLSLNWLGFIKFGLVGWLMGMLYRHGLQQSFFGMLLYAYMLGPAMHAISHGTHMFLVTKWAYFGLLAFPAFYYARADDTKRVG